MPVGALVTFPWVSAHAEARLEILSPQPGAVEYTNRSASVVVRYAPLVDDTDVSVVATLSRSAAEGEAVMFVAGLHPAGGSDRAELRWEPAEVSSGNYRLVVRALRAGEVVAQQAVEIRVNRPPAVDVAAVAIRPTEAGVEATLLARAESPDGVPVTLYNWLPGAGAKAVESEGPKQTLVFAYSAEPVFLYLSAVDTMGGSTDVVHRARVPDSFVTDLGIDPKDFLLQAPPPPPPCGCTNMTIRWAQGQRSGVYCLPAAEFARGEFPGCTRTPAAQIPAGEGCPAGQVPATCELNVLDFTGLPVPRRVIDRRLGFGFEVVADLVNGSTAASCEEGQFTRADRVLDNTIMRNGPSEAQPAANTRHTFPKPNPPGGNLTVETIRATLPVPPLNSQYWGSDDYARPHQNKRHLGNKIRWYDMPGIGWRGRLRIPSTIDDDFVAFVKGSTGQCWCQFQVKQRWSPRTLSQPAPGMGGKFVKKIDGLNCQVP